MRPYENVISNFACLVDDKTGIIKNVEVVKIIESDPRIFLAYAHPCNTIMLNGLKAANRGAACSANIERAIVRACGESVERYCSSFFNIRSFKLATDDELKKSDQKFISTNSIYPYHPDQYEAPDFPFEKTENRKIRWDIGYNVISGENTYIPASCVYVPYLFDKKVEPFTHMPISTGLAAGNSEAYCLEKGLMEIIERDALMLTWYLKKKTPRLTVESCYGLLPEIDAILDLTFSQESAWYISLLTLDIEVPVICAVLIDKSNNPPLTSFGVSANADPVRALLLALEEAALTRMLLNRSKELLEDSKYIHSCFNSLRDHMLSHATSIELRNGLKFITEEGDSIRFERLKERFVDTISLTAELDRLGFEIIYKDITTPDVKSLGFHVGRTIIPGMQPLDNDHRYRYLGGNRIKKIAKETHGHKYEELAINEDPHPFP